MSATRYKKLLGLALGEKSLLAAEVAAGPRPQVLKLAEMAYPDGVTLQTLGDEKTAEQVGIALGKFVAESGFNSRVAVVGIPVKWLLVKPKEVPPASAATLAQLLRLQAETEFSSELKDLVYDYAEAAGGGANKQVLLLATQSRNVQLIERLCEAARIKIAAITPSVLALGRRTGGALKRDLLVLSVGSGASELTVQEGALASSIRHLRPIDPRSPFVSEFRRAVSTLPGLASDREIVIWDGARAHDQGATEAAAALTEQIGITVRSGRLATLGVDTSLAGANGDGQKYASAVALALSGITDESFAVDFLHSRLAPPPQQRIPTWAYAAAGAAVCIIAVVLYAMHDLNVLQANLDAKESSLAKIQAPLTTATAFVSKVSVAQSWHAGQPRYLACLRDLTQAIPNDGQTYSTNFTLKEITATAGAVPGKDPDVGKLFGQLDGKTADQQHATELPDRLKVNPAFSEVTLVGTNYLPRERTVSFSITFKYDPKKAAQ